MEVYIRVSVFCKFQVYRKYVKQTFPSYMKGIISCNETILMVLDNEFSEYGSNLIIIIGHGFDY